MKGKHGRIRLVLLPLLSGLCLLLSAHFARALWQSRAELEGEIQSSALDTRIEEDYLNGQTVFPGEEIEKRVYVRNSGRCDAIVRVRLEKDFGDSAPGDADPELILLRTESSLWRQGGDGWYYYLKILKSGERTKEPVMTSFVLSPLADLSLRGLQGEIRVYLESVQAGGEAYRLWGKTKEEISLAYRELEQASAGRVVFKGEKEGFFIGEENLLSAFYELTPACKRGQTLSLVNESKESVRIRMQAEVTGSETEPEKKKQLERLFGEFAHLSVQQGKDLLYEGPLSGLKGETADLLQAELSPGESRDFFLTLSLDEKTDNACMDLRGRIRFLFTAEGSEGESPSPSPVPTPGETDRREDPVVTPDIGPDGGGGGENNNPSSLAGTGAQASQRILGSAVIAAPATGDDTPFLLKVVLPLLTGFLLTGAAVCKGGRRKHGGS